MEISGKKVVVIGGASGMGRATAELLAERGAHVAVLDRENSDGKAVAEGLGGAFYPVDVTDFTGTEETLQTAVDNLGGLHVAVTTAGGGIAKRTLTKSGPHDLESFQSVIDLNLIATFNISRLAAAHMAKNEPEDPEATGERGVIINTASIAAFEGQIGQVAYTAAKAAIAGMCLTMARDLGSMGIRVLAIAPSLFLTGLTAMVPDEMAAQLVKDAAFPKRMGRPIEYAKLAAAIVDNPMLNGQCIRLDAGQRFAPK
ncbi:MULTISPECIES: SDR family NAD(P)-dependent oxidoreductase [Mycobacterium]|uniref:3-hydroxy-2-methylbutyryl-CoA dehydrogenase n=1 Tax=Mycobacterium persicum TaxID=1487726 RepID=A0A1X0LE69_9MYCO|nr:MULTISPECIES: SDR family NAD(P)-dependent oxidoreductase [Mycobacterium]KZS84630.1 3-hydroxy-2-methylbutyryl-CoA dehydrogenase [Mycobacterium persicum]ORB56583.1 3-hydroxy-2-methylbutyryl-CoA dehydrogenase [Mycobacterium persicum]ORB91515.1 3-hydroxy-2-methylbutyryl-CoA dehydrogenase [Mycobacterium persicum]ORB96883.1 3-hydroxy-2-methylbutyryl-CoA dehydrogenase [Mycobacterium persicum]ORC09051.1 3-hydroxy-2-methylbutyryl-CoA dehydrogenase [Mycobacterium persicum]